MGLRFRVGGLGFRGTCCGVPMKVYSIWGSILGVTKNQ